MLVSDIYSTSRVKTKAERGSDDTHMRTVKRRLRVAFRCGHLPSGVGVQRMRSAPCSSSVGATDTADGWRKPSALGRRQEVRCARRARAGGISCKSCFLTFNFFSWEIGLPPLSFLASHFLSFSASLLMQKEDSFSYLWMFFFLSSILVVSHSVLWWGGKEVWHVFFKCTDTRKIKNRFCKICLSEIHLNVCCWWQKSLSSISHILTICRTILNHEGLEFLILEGELYTSSSDFMLRSES